MNTILGSKKKTNRGIDPLPNIPLMLHVSTCIIEELEKRETVWGYYKRCKPLKNKI